MKQFNILRFIVGLLLCLCTQAKAQESPASEDLTAKEKIRSAEIAYLSKQLDLTPEEAQKFWPMYNNYRHEVELLIAERRRNRRQDKTDDATARKALDKEMDIDQRLVNVRTRYKQEFLKALPPRKAGSVFEAEREFRGQLLRQLKERGANRGAPGRRFNRN